MDGLRKYAKKPEDAASVIVNGLFRNKSSIHFSFLMWYFGGLHPVIQQCISWLCMPGPEEPNHVFQNYLSCAHEEEKIQIVEMENQEEKEVKDEEAVKLMNG